MQINVQIQTIRKKINIADVLKPTEAALATLAIEEAAQVSAQDTNSSGSKSSPNESPSKQQFKEEPCEVETAEEDKELEADVAKPVLNWVLDSKFKREQMRLKIPEAVSEWTQAHVAHWLEWAIKEFELRDINLAAWHINGQSLCAMTHEEFSRKLPRDPGNVFWTHLQLLKECNFVSVVHKQAEELRKPNSKQSKASIPVQSSTGVGLEQRIMRKSYQSVKSNDCESNWNSIRYTQN